MNEPSPARIGLDLLLAAHPGFDLLEAEMQRGGPWLLVTLGLAGGEAWARYPFAIWKRTGAVHGLEPDGAASDDPIFRPA